ncbi:2-hydroxymuconate tautomerase family protein [Pelosinus sp. UFO1]|uniref:2-hydroxymuconate tautomerase family protein n=1 Tax=Pelosinus sp. UFO1 TaxID=484770 RepID=UPI0004D12070|nr:2-hydroxymuconate tautomerase family protein [Pelosinus sp. UFO1]AIF54129.1 4-oxalocrotonate tautomerase family enzyme [Pelosinus sp. UFO1]
MPFVNLKLVKGQTTSEQKKLIIEGITDLIVNIMGRDRNFTVITIDELEKDQWAIGGETFDHLSFEKRIVSFVNIKVSKGTTNPNEMERMMKATKELMISILGTCDETSYFIIDELNPDGWGFDGMSMSERNKG